jgi:hypothetical protein
MYRMVVVTEECPIAPRSLDLLYGGYLPEPVSFMVILVFMVVPCMVMTDSLSILTIPAKGTSLLDQAFIVLSIWAGLVATTFAFAQWHL